MSVEAPKPVEETPVVEPTTKPLPEQPESSIAHVDTPIVAPVDPVEPTPAVAEEPVVAATAEETKKDETVVDAVPASEGVLGYKEPTFFKYAPTWKGAAGKSMLTHSAGNSSSPSTTFGSRKSHPLTSH